MNPALALRGVSAGYPTSQGWLPVVEDLSLAVEEGAWVSLVGPSGCGKTTILRVAAGLLRPRAGEVGVIGGSPRGGVAYLPQGETLLPWRTALGNLLAAREVDGRLTPSDRAEAGQILAQFGLGPFTGAYPHELSGGMRQRVALLRTFLAQRPVLLLDEPLGALDALTRIEVQEWLRRVQEDLPRTGVVVTHDVEEALFLAHRVVVLSARPARVQAEFPGHPGGERTAPEFASRRAEVLAALRAGKGIP